MSIVNINNVDKTFFSQETATTALKDITLSIDNGEFISIIGPSGCGKTTLLSLIAGLIQPTNGEIIIEGQQILRPSPKTGYMLQQDYLFPWLTIEQNITIGLKTMKKLTQDTKEHALSLLDKMRLIDKKNDFPSQLSGGMRQRVALVRMLATQPTLLLLDEPFSALDYQTKLKLEDLVSHTIKEQKKTAILVTHDIGEAIAMSDRIVLLSARPGTIYQIFEIPQELRVLMPFQARNHPRFNELFQLIWKELESLE
ncbi:spermidine/putrescine ABC transporter ATP-binding protein [Anaerobacillus alkalidiazotrophicus]|uniref:Spermidine/putrescine ABC transporter ATP-binding protein n=1 Tax=Anaerobacillus alkalidiazotrophicus TaxID=472963 RepID=A0A1S2M4U3_9BACI|nr:ABC transporter ATP-binding protein [Anaerobacillus alkalidiazotrophicus]OIJ18167.1 spermidine/putrescine ABC transporter ATP-binding protein [Anaerobacillus alkalidiazotrophicus]OIJ19646.1 spermidine/putrescine ABC transporter ATP-binding protein [Anaerobacillus alkalidiazotrophicus]